MALMDLSTPATKESGAAEVKHGSWSGFVFAVVKRFWPDFQPDLFAYSNRPSCNVCWKINK